MTSTPNKEVSNFHNLIIFLTTVLSELFLIFVTIPFAFLFVGLFMTNSNYIEIYLTIIVASALTIFLFDTELKVKSKILGFLFTIVVATGMLYLWAYYSPKHLTLYGLLFGFPTTLISSKIIYKKLSSKISTIA